MLRKIILDSDKSHSSSTLTDAGGKSTTRLLKRNRRFLPNKRVKSKIRFNKKKVKTSRKSMKRKKELEKRLPHYNYAKWLEMRKMIGMILIRIKTRL